MTYTFEHIRRGAMPPRIPRIALVALSAALVGCVGVLQAQEPLIQAQEAVTGGKVPQDVTEASDRTRLAFFEKLYKTRIEGVKPLETYPDPDQFYSAIASKVGIPKLAFKAVEKEFGWSQDGEFLFQAMVKGGAVGDYWGVMVVKVPKAIATTKNLEERKRLLKQMEMKFVSIQYDGTITFPREKKKKATQEKAETP